MSESSEAVSSAAPDSPPNARAARLAKFRREQLIVDYLNRGVSVAEIAARLNVGEKRMRENIREILARRMPAPPEEFVAIQVSRLNEALLVAYGAMASADLKAVDRVVRIVRELDRYHGFLAAKRRLPLASRSQALVEATATFGAALVCRPEFAPKSVETIEFAPGITGLPKAASPLGSLSLNRYGEERSDEAIHAAAAPCIDGLRRSACRDAVGPAAPDEDPAFAPGKRRENPPQGLEIIESALGFAATGAASDDGDAGREQACAIARAEPRPDGRAPDAPPDDRLEPSGSDVLASNPEALTRADAAIPGSAERAEAAESAAGLRPGRRDGGERPWTPSVPLSREKRPENLPQGLETIESAPEARGPAETPAPGRASVSPVSPSPSGFRRVNVQMLLNGVAVC